MSDDFVLLPFGASATLVYRLVLEHIPVDTLAIIGPDACDELLQELESGDVLEEWVEGLSHRLDRPVVYHPPHKVDDVCHIAVVTPREWPRGQVPRLLDLHERELDEHYRCHASERMN